MVRWQPVGVNFYDEYQPPAEFDSDRMNEVEARWALLKLKRWERVAAKSEELESRPDAESLEISHRIWSLRCRYYENVGVAPDGRSELRRWLTGFLPLEKRPTCPASDGLNADLD